MPDDTDRKERAAEVDPHFPVVGVGASAGGLSAFEAFFSAMPAETDTGMAFVLVQHLSPDHESILSDLVKRYTPMRVYDVEDGVKVEPNCAYIIPPNRDMAFLNGTLQLLPPSAPRGLRLPIDFFFRSLAHDQRERAICIVLSGTGSDGTLGARAVKGEGGMVMAQEPDSTQYDGMPRSVIATGLVDYVLQPKEMPGQLIAYVAHAFGKRLPSPVVGADDTLQKICVVLRNQVGHDFSQYKENTLVRRIERRLALHQIDKPEEYLRYLQRTPPEVDALFRDLLIGVTSFFRDPEAFQALESEFIPTLVKGKAPGTAIRVWVCGCSTGEEAYSIAIVLQEYLSSLKQNFKVQIFATDIDHDAIEHARAGVYPASIAADVSDERLARFFVLDERGGFYRVHKVIRDLLIFSEQDVIRDPPFSKLDLLSCRNLLIYLGAPLQKRLIPLFHYALRSEGTLFLGSSESVGEFTTLFEARDRKSKLYHRHADIPGTVRPVFGGLSTLPLRTEDRSRPTPARDPEGKVNLRRMTEKAMLAHYGRIALLVTGRGEVLHLYGRTGKFLELAPGDAGMNILSMAREGLRRELTTALHKAVSTMTMAAYPGLQVKTDGGRARVDLSVLPATGDAAGLFLVLLEEVPDDPTPDVTEANADQEDNLASQGLDSRILELEQELRAKDEYLQTTLEEMETSNEELKSTNEEMQSVNEELQSTNEELETSKEELQSVNEELATVNAELQQKVSDLSRANNDMNNLLAGTGVGTLFVDHSSKIVRFTPAATSVINLIPTDVGRPVSHIASNLQGYDRLVQDVQAVLDSLVGKEVEVQTTGGDWYMMRIQPYRTLDNVIEGVVITFMETTASRRVEELRRETEERYRALVAVNPGYIGLMAKDGEVLYLNPLEEQPTEDELIGHNAHDMLAPESRPILQESLRRAFNQPGKTVDYEVVTDRGQHLRGRMVTVDDDRVLFVTMDTTELHEAKGALREAEDRYRTP